MAPPTIGKIIPNMVSLETFLLVFWYVVVSGPTAHGITRTYTGLNGMTQEILHGFVMVLLFLVTLSLLPVSPQHIGGSSGSDALFNIGSDWN